MKLSIKDHNLPLLRQIAESMSDSSLTSAINFVLETQGLTVLEQLQGIRAKKQPSADTSCVFPVSSSSTVEPQVPSLELDRSSVESAFD